MILYSARAPVNCLKQSVNILLSASYLGLPVVLPEGRCHIESDEVAGDLRDDVQNEDAVGTEVLVHETGAVALLGT